MANTPVNLEGRLKSVGQGLKRTVGIPLDSWQLWDRLSGEDLLYIDPVTEASAVYRIENIQDMANKIAQSTVTYSGFNFTIVDSNGTPYNYIVAGDNVDLNSRYAIMPRETDIEYLEQAILSGTDEPNALYNFDGRLTAETNISPAVGAGVACNPATFIFTVDVAENFSAPISGVGSLDIAWFGQYHRNQTYIYIDKVEGEQAKVIDTINKSIRHDFGPGRHIIIKTYDRVSESTTNVRTLFDDYPLVTQTLSGMNGLAVKVGASTSGDYDNLKIHTEIYPFALSEEQMREVVANAGKLPLSWYTAATLEKTRNTEDTLSSALSTFINDTTTQFETVDQSLTDLTTDLTTKTTALSSEISSNVDKIKTLNLWEDIIDLTSSASLSGGMFLHNFEMTDTNALPYQMNVSLGTQQFPMDDAELSVGYLYSGTNTSTFSIGSYPANATISSGALAKVTIQTTNKLGLNDNTIRSALIDVQTDGTGTIRAITTAAQGPYAGISIDTTGLSASFTLQANYTQSTGGKVSIKTAANDGDSSITLRGNIPVTTDRVSSSFGSTELVTKDYVDATDQSISSAISSAVSANYQPTLSAGDGIAIENNVVKVTYPVIQFRYLDSAQ